MFFGFFSTFLFYILLVETQDKKTMGNKTLKITMTEKKKKKIPRFPCFRFWPIPDMENLEISKSFRLLSFTFW